MVIVRAPASTANLGPGFDCLGAALSIGLELKATVSDNDWWTVMTPDPEEVSIRIVLAAAEAVAGDLPKLHGEMNSQIPISAGLGSSAAAIAAGLLLGCALNGDEPDPERLLAIGTPIEGHPDNLAPTLFGGLTLVVPGGEVLRFAPSPMVRPFVLLPRERLSTTQARGVLPDHVPRADAVANIARASGLLAVLTGAAEPTRARLLACTEDLLHQSYRAPLMPKTADAIRRLREDGVPAAVSGAGPSILCLVAQGEEEHTRSRCTELDGWELLELSWELEGARIEESS